MNIVIEPDTESEEEIILKPQRGNQHSMLLQLLKSIQETNRRIRAKKPLETVIAPIEKLKQQIKTEDSTIKLRD